MYTLLQQKIIKIVTNSKDIKIESEKLKEQDKQINGHGESVTDIFFKPIAFTRAGCNVKRYVPTSVAAKIVRNKRISFSASVSLCKGK